MHGVILDEPGASVMRVESESATRFSHATTGVVCPNVDLIFPFNGRCFWKIRMHNWKGNWHVNDIDDNSYIFSSERIC